MFWERFVSLCAENNTKPNPVASQLGISSGAVTKWKSGTIPSSVTIHKIAEFFHVSVDYLLGKTDEKQQMEKTLDEQLANEQFALYGEVKDLTDEEKEAVLNFIRFTKAQRKEKESKE